MGGVPAHGRLPMGQMACAGMVSVVIVTKNGCPYIERTLATLSDQKVASAIETIVVDSGSSDETIAHAASFGARIVEIAPDDFGHGRTRNLGATLAKGDVLVFLNQDAVPADRLWLQRLIDVLDRHPQVAGVHSRELPRAECDPLRAREMAENFLARQSDTFISQLSDGERLDAMPVQRRRWLLAFGTVSCAIRRDVWERHPFPDVAYAEDLFWARNILEAGYWLAYEPRSRVVHSHNTYSSIWATLQRQMLDGAARRAVILSGGRGFPLLLAPKYLLTSVWRDWSYIGPLQRPLLYRAEWMLRSPLVRLTQVAAQGLGALRMRHQ